MTEIGSFFRCRLEGNNQLRLSDIVKQASEEPVSVNEEDTEAVRKRFRESLREVLRKRAAEDKADLRASDPYQEYARRVSHLRKTGGEYTPRDFILAVQAVQALKVHGRRARLLTGEKNA